MYFFSKSWGGYIVMGLQNNSKNTFIFYNISTKWPRILTVFSTLANLSRKWFLPSSINILHLPSTVVKSSWQAVIQFSYFAHSCTGYAVGFKHVQLYVIEQPGKWVLFRWASSGCFCSLLPQEPDGASPGYGGGCCCDGLPTGSCPRPSCHLVLQWSRHHSRPRHDRSS